ncbi:MAG: Hpt domain-containing protein [Nannocystaceae bacterium]|nr:Hpt domain-containing protein [Nannocystaceae bacterium]
MLQKILQAVILPKEITKFEQEYLQRMNRIALVFFLFHVPVFAAVAFFNDTGVGLALGLTVGALIGPVVAYFAFTNPRNVSAVHGFTSMVMGALLVHFGQGPVQIEMHFYFFVLLALLAVFANPTAIIVAAVTAAVHHLGLWLWLPTSIFNYDAPVWVVAIHAGFVVLESVAACFIAKSFFDNVIGLDKIVQKRTAEVDQRNRDMRVVLDNVHQGLLTVSAEGVVAPEYSARVAEWFGEVAPGTTLAQLIGGKSSNAGELFDVGWDQVQSGFMPPEVTLDQLPKQIDIDGQVLEFEYRSVGSDPEIVERALIVITDRTEERRAQATEAEQRETLRVFERVMADKSGFLEFFDEASEIVANVVAELFEDHTLLKRALHTLKGNAAIFQIQTVADLSHAMESRLVEEGERPSKDQLALLSSRWQGLKKNLDMLLGTRRRSTVEVEDAEFESLLSAVLGDVERDQLAQRIASWKLEPATRRLDGIADRARTVARRLNKENVEIDVESGEHLLDPARWSSFWASFVHVIRNAIDHGIESTEDRLAAGKSANGHVVLRSYVEDDQLVVQVQDDGRGVDWDRVRVKAADAGIAHGSQQDLVAALFADGISTRDQVSQISGRGVGMAAVRAACTERQGRVQVHSRDGSGTTVEFRFPAAQMAPSPEELCKQLAA